MALWPGVAQGAKKTTSPAIIVIVCIDYGVPNIHCGHGHSHGQREMTGSLNTLLSPNSTHFAVPIFYSYSYSSLAHLSLSKAVRATRNAHLFSITPRIVLSGHIIIAAQDNV